MVHPNYVEEEPKVPAVLEPTGPVNCFLFSEQIGTHFYREWIDLQSVTDINSIRFFVPKIAPMTFRPKLALNIWTLDGK